MSNQDGENDAVSVKTEVESDVEPTMDASSVVSATERASLIRRLHVSALEPSTRQSQPQHIGNYLAVRLTLQCIDQMRELQKVFDELKLSDASQKWSQDHSTQVDKLESDLGSTIKKYLEQTERPAAFFTALHQEATQLHRVVLDGFNGPTQTKYEISQSDKGDATHE